jgi:hypothetical protein
MIVTGEDLRRAREELGWTVYRLGTALRLGGSVEKGGQRVRELERGARQMSGPIAVAVEAFVAGFRPVLPREPTHTDDRERE